MGMKKRAEPEPNWKEIAQDLAGGLVFALKYLEAPGGAGMMIGLKTAHVRRWEDDFMDRLDRAGYVVDRELYWKDRNKQSKRKKRR